MEDLDKDDEFFGINFSQVSSEGTRVVKPITYALMTWWKVRMGEEDIIDISEDSNVSVLRYQPTITGGDELSFCENDEIDLDNFIEVDEQEKKISMFSYLPNKIPDELVNELAVSLMNINPLLEYGSVELYTPKNSEESVCYLRYRVSNYLNGIKVGKIDVVENMVNYAIINIVTMYSLLCENQKFKNWLLN